MPAKQKYFFTKEYLEKEYLINGKSFSQIAREHRTATALCCMQLVRHWAVKFGIPRRKCGSRFGFYNVRWNPTGILKHGGGYNLERVPDKNPSRCQSRGYILQHRLIAEKIVGRPLKTFETVHHKDGNKINNVPKNLIVFPSDKCHQQYQQSLLKFAMSLTYGELSVKYPELKAIFENLVKDIPIVKE